MCNVIILAGPSGAGKSTFARRFDADKHVVCSADDYFMTPDGRYDFRPGNLPEAHGACLRKFMVAVAGTRLVIVDNTNCTSVEIAPYLAIAQAHEANIEVRVFDAPLITLIARAQHGAPSSAIERQQGNLHAMLAAWPLRWPAPARHPQP